MKIKNNGGVTITGGENKIGKIKIENQKTGSLDKTKELKKSAQEALLLMKEENLTEKNGEIAESLKEIIDTVDDNPDKAKSVLKKVSSFVLENLSKSSLAEIAKEII